MSLNPRDLTQGGQVAFMRLKMFLQINNLISYYVIMGTVLFGIAVLLMRISIQNLTNGIIVTGSFKPSGLFPPALQK